MERKDAISWFEIPATDFARAKRFYETVLATELRDDTMGPMRLAIFPYAAPGVGGCVITGEGLRPSRDGNLVYLQAGESLKIALGRVQRAGGQVALDATTLPDGMGVYAHIIDSEGNRVGLHAPA
jgi:predicted enzyme related to lactoylglutathione lyase